MEQHYLTVSAVSSDVPQVGHGIAKTRVRLKPHDDAGLSKASLHNIIIHTSMVFRSLQGTVFEVNGVEKQSAYK